MHGVLSAPRFRHPPQKDFSRRRRSLESVWQRFPIRQESDYPSGEKFIPRELDSEIGYAELPSHPGRNTDSQGKVRF